MDRVFRFCVVMAAKKMPRVGIQHCFHNTVFTQHFRSIALRWLSILSLSVFKYYIYELVTLLLLSKLTVLARKQLESPAFILFRENIQ